MTKSESNRQPVEKDGPYTMDASQLQALADAQEAEHILFQYIIGTAIQLETPPVILKKLASSLGEPQRLPATQILQLATKDPLAHPLTTLISLDGLLEGEQDDASSAFEQEVLALSDPSHDHTSQWISIGYQDRSAETVQQNSLAPSSLESPSLPTAGPNKFFPIVRIIFFMLVAAYVFLSFKTGSFSPKTIIETLTASQKHVELPSQPHDTLSRQKDESLLHNDIEKLPTELPPPVPPDNSNDNSPHTVNDIGKTLGLPSGGNLFDATSNNQAPAPSSPLPSETDQP